MPNAEPAIRELVEKKKLRLISREEDSRLYAIDTRGAQDRAGQEMVIIRYELLIREHPDEGESRLEIVDANEHRTGDTILCTDLIDDVVHWINDHSPTD